MGTSINNIKQLIIYPYWILNKEFRVKQPDKINLIIYPYWILNNDIADFRNGGNNL